MQLRSWHIPFGRPGLVLLRGAWCAAVLGLLPAVPARAGDDVHATYHSFSDSEENHIDSWVMEYGTHWADAWSAGLRGALDRVHLPPLPGLPGSRENVDAITAASRPVRSAADSKQSFLKERQELTGSIAWAPRGRSVRGAGSYYVSRESDYLAQQVSGEVSRAWNAGMTGLGLRTSYGYDRIHPDTHLDGDPALHTRTSLDVTATCTQTFSPTLQGEVGVELTAVSGFQSNPYRQVYVAGTKLPERHPDARLRRAVFGQVDRWFSTRASGSIGVRYYNDDWGVNAGTFDARFNQYVGDHFVVRYRYRYHTQTAAEFYRDLYSDPAAAQGFRTGDYKLQDFDSNLFGIKVSVPFEGWVSWTDGLVLDLKYERYFDSNSFAAHVLEAGFSWPF